MPPMRLLGAAAAAFVLNAGAATGARAGAWCAWENAYTYNCGFSSFAQCLDTIRGLGGFCRANPYEPDAGAAPPRQRAPSRR
jgi:hypothetical protein